MPGRKTRRRDDAWYRDKLKRFRGETLLPDLEPAAQAFLTRVALRYRLTVQELRLLAGAARDLSMWGEMPIWTWWEKNEVEGEGRKTLARFQSWYQAVKGGEKEYSSGNERPSSPRRLTVHVEKSGKKISGLCPVASPATLCCRLRTIDAVENCPYGCTYCVIKTFYGERAVFDRDFRSKLERIDIEQDRLYHFGTGQASDSLVWGNRNDILSDLLDFARLHPNVLLELKTKSSNVGYLLENEVPPNLVCSWSLNPDVIIRNEELGTPLLAERLMAARAVADRGVRVAFHFHPMVYYKGWEKDYRAIGRSLQHRFSPREVSFVSYGSVTMIKPAINSIRKAGVKSKILQMETARDPKGKLTYPDHVKIRLFRHMHDVMRNWHDRVYFYLCMEKRNIWQEVLGFAYESNEEFELVFCRRSLGEPGGNSSPDRSARAT